MSKPKIHYNYRELVAKRVAEGWKVAPYIGRKSMLWPPADHPANKDRRAADFIKVGPNLYIPHWGLG